MLRWYGCGFSNKNDHIQAVQFRIISLTCASFVYQFIEEQKQKSFDAFFFKEFDTITYDAVFLLCYQKVFKQLLTFRI